MVSVIVFGILNLLKKMMQMWNQSWNFVTGMVCALSRLTAANHHSETRRRHLLYPLPLSLIVLPTLTCNAHHALF